MGKKQGPTQSAQHREALSAKRKITTFLLTFSVVLAALVVTLGAVQNRDASCQDRAHELTFDLFVDADASENEVLSLIDETLQQRRCVLDDIARSDKVRTTEVMDTEDALLAARGFSLLRVTLPDAFRFDLVTVLPKLCNTYPSLSMESLVNVDHEKSNYHIKAIPQANSNSAHFSFISSVRTQDRNRFNTFFLLQSVFPGFQGLTTKAKMVIVKQFKTSLARYAQVYFDGKPMDIALFIERWEEKGKPLVWRVGLSTFSMQTEADAVSLYETLTDAFSSRKLKAGSSAILAEYLR